jgi:hypothetical protein
MEVAEKEPMVSKFHKPVVRFLAYGDSSINCAAAILKLLDWISQFFRPKNFLRSNGPISASFRNWNDGIMGSGLRLADPAARRENWNGGFRESKRIKWKKIR